MFQLCIASISIYMMAQVLSNNNCNQEPALLRADKSYMVLDSCPYQSNGYVYYSYTRAKIYNLHLNHCIIIPSADLTE